VAELRLAGRLGVVRGVRVTAGDALLDEPIALLLLPVVAADLLDLVEHAFERHALF
jgi:hypothetical protein